MNMGGAKCTNRCTGDNTAACMYNCCGSNLPKCKDDCTYMDMADGMSSMGTKGSMAACVQDCQGNAAMPVCVQDCDTRGANIDLPKCQQDCKTAGYADHDMDDVIHRKRV